MNNTIHKAIANRRLHLAGAALAALLCLAGSSGPVLTIDAAGVKVEQASDGFLVTVPVERSGSRRAVGVLEATVLGERYQELGTRKKRVFVSDKHQVEQIVVPLSDKADVPPGRLPSVLLRLNGQQVFAGNYAYAGNVEIDILGQSEWAAGSRTAVRVVASDSRSSLGLGGVGVRLRLVEPQGGTEELFSGTTDNAGTVDAAFAVPNRVVEAATLRAELTVNGTTQTIDQPVRIVEDSRILLTLDKPLYQPNQRMHIRALALKEQTLHPIARKEIVIEIEDARGNKVFKQALQTSDYGVAGVDFDLADEVNEGRYTVRAILGERKAERTVTVKSYVLPKFKIAIHTERDSYQAGEIVRGHIQADYFFGKPVAGSAVKIVASSYDIGQQAFSTVEGPTIRTDQTGRYAFEVVLPDRLFGQPLLKGGTQVSLEVTVTDEAGHSETNWHDVTVTKDPLILDVIAEAGALRRDLENEVYVLATYPDGRPAQVRLDIQVDGRAFPQSVTTDALGFASLKVTPAHDKTTLVVTATDPRDQRATLEKVFDTGRADVALLLRTDLAAYKVGEQATIDVWSAGLGDGVVFLDVIRNRQTLLTRTIDLVRGHGQIALPVDASLFGTLQVSAYKILPNSEMVRDTRTVYVRRADDLVIEFATGRPEYRPGEQAELEIKVRDAQGRGVAAAVGLDVVNESVFALSENKPGLLQQYFTLEEDLLKPRIQVRGFSLREIAFKPLDELEPTERGGLLKMSLVAEEQPERYTLRYDSRRARREEVAREIGQLWDSLFSSGTELPQSWTSVEALLIATRQLTARESAVDPWGNPYWARKVKKDQQERVQLASAGPDGVLDSRDDIVQDLAMFEGRRLGRAGAFGGPEAAPLAFMRRKKNGQGMDEGVGVDMMFAADGLSVEEKPGTADFAATHEKGRLSRGDITAPEGGGTADKPTFQEPARVRSWFAETLLSRPAIITGDNGVARITFPLADNITTWRMTGQANSLAGQLGSATGSLTVFQEFFIDPDLPVALTKGDEIEIPIAIHNYLKEPQDVRVVLTQAPWFDLVGATGEVTLHVQSEQVTAVRFRLRAKELGKQKLLVHGYGTRQSDAVQREIEVLPNGRAHTVPVSERLIARADRQNTKTIAVDIPDGAIPGAAKVLVTLHPGTFSQVLEGMENIYQMPYGCFEQTSSVTYPNILVLDYMRRAGQITPEIEIKAKEYINMGYQRLLSYEVPGGGFQVWGNPPATRILTAYGLEEFYDMSKVHYVDPNVITRTQQWLAGQQQGDGSWKPDDQFVAHAEMWKDINDSNLVSTAYIAHALAYTGYRGPEVARGLEYLRMHAAQARDTFSLVHLAEALSVMAPEDPLTGQTITRLRGLAVESADEAYWETPQTFSYACGNVATIEMTARAALVFMNTRSHGDVVNKALLYLLRRKDPNGTWQSTHATVQALRAFVKSMEAATETAVGKVTVSANGGAPKTVEITEETRDVYRLIDLGADTRLGNNQVTIALDGTGTLCYQVVARYYMPWEQVRPPEPDVPLTIDVQYDRTELRTNDTVTCKVNIANRSRAIANMVMVDIGTPPGFDADRDDLEALRKKETIAKFAVTGRQVSLYLDKLDAGQQLSLSFRMKARFPLVAKTPQSKVYQYYNPEIMALAAPVDLIVHD